MNELHNEKSPYLLQHKTNPVWWKAWNSKSLAKAKNEDKLILLSIGYATCHWCHVMEHESFEDQKVAEVLNANFVSIKVDREELPDVDQIYMDAIHAMGQRGGWPLNVILTPELKPVYGGTYFPKPHFLKLLDQLQQLWKSERAKMLETSEQLYSFLNAQTEQFRNIGSIPSTVLDTFVDFQTQQFDKDFGGFGSAPKFPPQSQLALTLRLIQQKQKLRNNAKPNAEQSSAPNATLSATPNSLPNNSEALLLEQAEKTLQEMARGGLYDHIGGGFTRYSVDEKWEIPHFEKMLYVNSQAIENYVEAYQLTKNPQYLAVAEDVARYVLRDMLSNKAGFYSAEDADSLPPPGREEVTSHVKAGKNVEGAFYTWTLDELKAVLSEQQMEYLKTHFGITSHGNFEGGVNHLYISSRGQDFWSARLTQDFQEIQAQLLKIRDERERPLLDDKQLTSWNALMISAMAQLFRVTQNQQYLSAAHQSVNFIKRELYKNQKLFRRYRDGRADFEGTLDDYAYLIRALLQLYQADFNADWLIWAKELQDLQNQYFKDEHGGYFYTSNTEKNLLVRTKDYSDNALPNSNSVSIENLLWLSRIFGDSSYRELAKKSFMMMGEAVQNYPGAYATALISYFEQIENLARELVIVSEDQERVKQDLNKLSQEFHPYLFVLCKRPTEELSQVPILANRPSGYYLCEEGLCQAPSQSMPSLMC